MKRYLVVFEKSKTGFSAYSPDIPGCISTGRTKAETEKNMYEAIQFHLEGMKIEGLRLPKRVSEAEVYCFN
jgi:predicted RNase H-like HicB family nuclease